MAKLTEKQIVTALAQLDGWKRSGDSIHRTFTKPDFVQAMGLVTSVGLLAQRVNHHPDIDIRWNKVKLTLSTHSEGGLTKKDVALAKAINSL